MKQGGARHDCQAPYAHAHKLTLTPELCSIPDLTIRSDCLGLSWVGSRPSCSASSPALTCLPAAANAQGPMEQTRSLPNSVVSAGTGGWRSEICIVSSHEGACT